MAAEESICLFAWFEDEPGPVVRSVTPADYHDDPLEPEDERVERDSTLGALALRVLPSERGRGLRRLRLEILAGDRECEIQREQVLASDAGPGTFTAIRRAATGFEDLRVFLHPVVSRWSWHADLLAATTAPFLVIPRGADSIAEHCAPIFLAKLDVTRDVLVAGLRAAQVRIDAEPCSDLGLPFEGIGSLVVRRGGDGAIESTFTSPRQSVVCTCCADDAVAVYRQDGESVSCKLVLERRHGTDWWLREATLAATAPFGGDSRWFGR